MREFLRSNLFIKILSVVAAVLMWLYVVQYENPMFQVAISDIPVKYENESALEEKQLMITAQSEYDITLKVKGKRKTVSKLDKTGVHVSIDLKNITGPGEYNLPVKVSFSENDVVVANSTMPRVRITVENKLEQEYKVRFKTAGEVKNGYFAVPDSADASVRVTLPESMLHLVSYARAEININGAERMVEHSSVVKLFDENGNEINSRYVKCEPASVPVRCLVYPVKEVPVVWNETGIMPLYGAGIVPSVERIKLAGPKELLAGIDSLNLGTVNLSVMTVANNMRFFSIEDNPAMDGLYIADGTKSVTLTLEFDVPKADEQPEKDDALVVSLKDFVLTGVPEGYTAEVLTSSISLSVSGDEDVLTDIKPEDFVVTVDLSQLTEEELTKPEHELKAVITTALDITVEEEKYIKIRLVPEETSVADETEEEQPVQ